MGMVRVLALLFLATQALADVDGQKISTMLTMGKLIGPWNGTSVSGMRGTENWKTQSDMMANVTIFDKTVKEIQKTVCGNRQNKAVLLIGDGVDAFRYIFARLGSNPNNLCKNFKHVEVQATKLIGGHHMVGDKEGYWNTYVDTPASNADVVIYFPNVSQLLGMGSHDGDSNGFEAQYADGILDGRYRTVAYLDSRIYGALRNGQYRNFFDSFSQVITIPKLQRGDLEALVSAYFTTAFPARGVRIEKKEWDYLQETIEFYQPDRAEPARTMAVIEKLYGNATADIEPFVTKKVKPKGVETEHPYQNNWKGEIGLSEPGCEGVQSITFEKFETEITDRVEVIDSVSGEVFETISGLTGVALTRKYNAQGLYFRFTTDGTQTFWGFKVAEAEMSCRNLVTLDRKLSLEEVRKAILEVVQIPAWLLNRDFQIIRDLKKNLEEEVIGSKTILADIVRLAKNGYVAGRTDDKPIATVLFAGPTGTGKSFIAKKLAEKLEMKLVTIDMTNYKNMYDAPKLQAILAESLLNNPHAVFLFEEIDKGSVEALDILYAMMNDGVLYDVAQRPIFARGAFVIMTTNAGANVVLQNQDSPDLQKLVNKDLQRYFRDSFLNRFDVVSIFKPFTQDEFRALAKVMLKTKAKKTKKLKSWVLSTDAGVEEYLAAYGQSAEFGARPMERLVENVIGAGLVEAQLMSLIPQDAKIAIRKDLQGAHDFWIKVNDGVEIPYTVDPDTNAGAN